MRRIDLTNSVEFTTVNVYLRGKARLGTNDGDSISLGLCVESALHAFCLRHCETGLLFSVHHQPATDRIARTDSSRPGEAKWWCADLEHPKMACVTDIFYSLNKKCTNLHSHPPPSIQALSRRSYTRERVRTARWRSGFSRGSCGSCATTKPGRPRDVISNNTEEYNSRQNE